MREPYTPIAGVMVRIAKLNQRTRPSNPRNCFHVVVDIARKNGEVRGGRWCQVRIKEVHNCVVIERTR